MVFAAPGGTPPRAVARPPPFPPVAGQATFTPPIGGDSATPPLSAL